MRYKDSAIGARRVAVGAVRAAGLLRRGWQDARYLNERLVQLQTPWEDEGPLRWRRHLRGWRLVGSGLPALPGPAEPDSTPGSGRPLQSRGRWRRRSTAVRR